MEWNKFKPLDIQTPEEVLKKMLIGFSEATNSLVEISVVTKSELGKVTSSFSAKFQYDVVLHSKYVKGYSFIVMELGYNIELYPFYVKLEDGIHKELNSGSAASSTLTKVPNQEDWKKTLELSFKTHRFNKVVSGLMKIASIELEKLKSS